MVEFESQEMRSFFNSQLRLRTDNGHGSYYSKDYVNFVYATRITPLPSGLEKYSMKQRKPFDFQVNGYMKLVNLTDKSGY